MRQQPEGQWKDELNFQNSEEADYIMNIIAIII